MQALKINLSMLHFGKLILTTNFYVWNKTFSRTLAVFRLLQVQLGRKVRAGLSLF